MEDSAFCRPLGQPLYRSNHHRPFPTPPGGRLLLDPRCWWCPLPAVLGLGNCRQLHMKFTLDLFRIHQGYFFFQKDNATEGGEILLCLPLHMTDTSSEWSQLLFPYPRWPQNWRPRSVPAQFTSSRKIGPVPRPKNALPFAVALALLNI